MAKFITTHVDMTQVQPLSFAELIMSSGALGSVFVMFIY